MKTLDDLLIFLEKIETDCFILKRKKQLTEYGEGQLDLIKLIKKQLETKGD